MTEATTMAIVIRRFDHNEVLLITGMGAHFSYAVTGFGLQYICISDMQHPSVVADNKF